MAVPTPVPADRFGLGLWTIGYNGTNPFGDRGSRFVELQQLATEPLLGAR